MKIRKISYLIETNSECILDCYLELLDMLGFKQDITLTIFRAPLFAKDLLKIFSNSNNCMIVEDVYRKDCFALYFANLQSNKLLHDLMQKMDVQTEFTYIPNCKNFEAILYNIKYIEKNSAVEYSLASYQIEFEQDNVLSLFVAESELTNKVCMILDKWENK